MGGGGGGGDGVAGGAECCVHCRLLKRLLLHSDNLAGSNVVGSRRHSTSCLQYVAVFASLIQSSVEPFSKANI